MAAAGSLSKPATRKPGGVVVPHRAKWRQRQAAGFVSGLLRGIATTVRFETGEFPALLAQPSREPVIFSIWHNRLAAALIFNQRCGKRYVGGKPMAAMVSASRDGGFLARVLELFGIEPVRGSSSRRGPQALREFATMAERGFDLVITPDGPRGPCYQVQDGVVHTAQLTGLAVVPVSFHLNWKVRPNSWDRFQIPLPFSRCRIRVGEFIRVPREIRDEDRAALRHKLKRAMMDLTVD